MFISNLSIKCIGIFSTFSGVILHASFRTYLNSIICILFSFSTLSCTTQKNSDNDSFSSNAYKNRLLNDQKVDILPPIHRVKFPKSIVTVVLNTFNGSGSEWSARQWVQTAQNVVPSSMRLDIFKVSKGHIVGFGRFKNLKDPNAQLAKEKIKKLITRTGSPQFPRAFLTSIREQRDLSKAKDWDLWSVRRKYPNKKPIYTLDVAQFGNINRDGNAILDGRYQRMAEQYCSNLRARGLEAYFYHSPERALSSVVVGLFSRHDLDQETGVWGPKIESFLETFPARIFNGSVNDGDFTQIPVLVEVPMP